MNGTSDMKTDRNRESSKKKEEERQDEELSALFSYGEDGEMREPALLLAAKKRSYLRMGMVSLLVALLLIGMAGILKIQITPYLLDRSTLQQSLYYATHGANLFVTPFDEQNRLFGSSATAVRYKLLQGIPVYEGQVSVPGTASYITVSGGDSPDFMVNQYEPEYTVYGNKAMQFFQPGQSYNYYSREFNKLVSLRENQVAELGLSFDQGYTMEELQNRLPKNVAVAWYWMDVQTGASEEQEPVEAGSGIIIGENDAAGFSAVDQTGVPKDNPEKTFLEDLRLGEKYGGIHKDEMKELYKIGTENPLKYCGVVVTGDKEALLSLSELPFIKAASLGATVELH